MDSAEPRNPSPNALSQSEVESLLAQVAQQEHGAVVHHGNGTPSSHGKDTIQPYDFRHSVLLSANELRALRLHHEEFVHFLESRLSMYLRLEFGLQLSQLQTQSYQKFTASLPHPCHLTLFKVEPLRGICALDISPRLGLAIVDRLLGGHGQPSEGERDLSEIEMVLLDQAVQIIIAEWCAHWAKLKDLQPVVLGHESNGRFLQTSLPETVMLVLVIEARIGDCLEQMQLAFPYTTLEPLIQQLKLKLIPQAEEAALRSAAAASQVKWRRDLDDVSIPITAEWPGMTMTARDLTRMKVGDMLSLPAQFSTQIQLRLARMTKFVGRLGTREQHWAVEITQIHKD